MHQRLNATLQLDPSFVTPIRRPRDASTGGSIQLGSPGGSRREGPLEERTSREKALGQEQTRWLKKELGEFKRNAAMFK
jgi:hypothetical protein